MNDAEDTRDRPYVRHIYVRVEDRDRFLAFLNTIPRNKFINRIKVENTHILYHLKLKKQELLYVELAFKVVVKKPARKKKKPVGPFSIFSN